MSWLAWLFPGQGTQCIGMGVAACKEFPEAKEVFAEADEVLGEPLSQWMAEGPEERLLWTVNAQPAILTASYALALPLLKRLPCPPAWLAGHSLGEYTALVVAQSLTFADALRIVRARSQFMDNAVPAGSGGMSAVLGLARRTLSDICAKVSEQQDSVVEIANYNSPVQTVIAGQREAVRLAGEEAMAQGAKRVVPLPVSGPFHTSLLRPARNQLSKFLQGMHISQAQLPVVANVSGKPMRNAGTIVRYMAQQVASPVLWEHSMRYLLEKGVQCFVEIGPRSVLLPLVRRLNKQVTTYPVTDPSSLLAAVEALQPSLQQDTMMEHTVQTARHEQMRRKAVDEALAYFSEPGKQEDS